jgi:TerC family integral membrane protein
MQAMPWILVGVTLAMALAVDLFTHRGGRHVSVKSAGIWTAIWIGLGLAFGLVVLLLRGSQAMQQYYAAYLIEESLSVDNLFVFLITFSALRIPRKHQHEVLFWGVFGALVFRGAFILAGAAALERWHWVNYVFGAVLLIAAVRALKPDSAPKDNQLLRWLSRHLPVTEQVEGARFFVRQNGRWQITPLLLALVGLELSDLLFAVDSVPAALSISRDNFVVYSSNALAICGLRSLFLILSTVLADLPYLHYGIGGVLLFTSMRMLTASWLSLPDWLSIVITVSCIGLSAAASLRARRPREEPVSSP